MESWRDGGKPCAEILLQSLITLVILEKFNFQKLSNIYSIYLM